MVEGFTTCVKTLKKVVAWVGLVGRRSCGCEAVVAVKADGLGILCPVRLELALSVFEVADFLATDSASLFDFTSLALIHFVISLVKRLRASRSSRRILRRSSLARYLELFFFIKRPPISSFHHTKIGLAVTANAVFFILKLSSAEIAMTNHFLLLLSIVRCDM